MRYRLRTLLPPIVVLAGIVAGGAIGSWTGWMLGDFGGRAEQENVWFFSLVSGVAVGLAFAVAAVLRRARGLAWRYSLLAGATTGIVAAAIVIALVALHR